MTNFYRLTNTQDGSLIYLFGTYHYANPDQLPERWFEIIREYRPAKIFTEIVNAVFLSNPRSEHVARIGCQVKEDETPAIDRLSGAEKIMLLAHSLSKLDNYTTIKEISSTWQSKRDIEDVQILEFETILKERVGSQLVENKKLFFESLNDYGLQYFLWILSFCSTYPSVTIDSAIAIRIKETTGSEEFGLENEEDRMEAVCPFIEAKVEHIDLEHFTSFILKNDAEKRSPLVTNLVLPQQLIEEMERSPENIIRNKKWLTFLDSYVDSKTPVVICVGLSHLIGENGLINEFTKKGYDKLEGIGIDGNSYPYDHLHGWQPIDGSDQAAAAIEGVSASTANDVIQSLEEREVSAVLSGDMSSSHEMT